MLPLPTFFYRGKSNVDLLCVRFFFLVLILSTRIRTRTYRSYSLSRRVVIAHRARSLTFYVVNAVVISREQFSSAGHIAFCLRL